MQNSEEITNPIYISVAAHVLINSCQKMVTQTIESGTALDLMLLQKQLDMAFLLLSSLESEDEKHQTTYNYEKPVAANVLINACQKIVTQTIESGTALDLMLLNKQLEMAILFLSSLETEEEKSQTTRKYEKPEIKDIFSFKN